MTSAPEPLPPRREATTEIPSLHDDLFAKPRELVNGFDFGPATAVVFDDMLGRSVPFYDEVQRMIGELAADFAVEGTNIVDLGCSTGTSLIGIAQALPPETHVRLIGVDSSPAMLEIGRKRLAAQSAGHAVELRCADLSEGVAIDNASVVLLVLTLQFIRPLRRERLVQSVYQGMTDDGCLILVEKVLGESSTLDRLFIKHYYEMKKRNGYSEIEIAQKREALENVLIPYRHEENRELLREIGFKHVDLFFKWYNFCGLIAMK